MQTITNIYRHVLKRKKRQSKETLPGSWTISLPRSVKRIIPLITFLETMANKMNQTEVTLKRSEASEDSPAARKGAEMQKQKEEGSSQRETSGVFGAQTHRPTAIHYKVGSGIGDVNKITDEI